MTILLHGAHQNLNGMPKGGSDSSIRFEIIVRGEGDKAIK